MIVVYKHMDAQWVKAVCDSQQTQQLQSDPSHRADHGVPAEEDKIRQFIFIIMEHIASMYKPITYLP